MINSSIVFCLPLETFMQKDVINGHTFFYYGDVDKILIEHDLNTIKNNFDSVSFELVKYLKYNNSTFFFKNPNSHYNLFLNVQCEFLNYYYSFPFSHGNLNHYEFLSKYDLNNQEIYKKSQY
jgi:hypothetical protein